VAFADREPYCQAGRENGGESHGTDSSADDGGCVACLGG